MSWIRAIACIICPPLGVLDRGAKAIALTVFLTVFGWLPGIVCALVYGSRPRPY
jgi:uncharacterized membrane protein YqaE (UPF0057 family)